MTEVDSVVAEAYAWMTERHLAKDAAGPTTTAAIARHRSRQEKTTTKDRKAE